MQSQAVSAAWAHGMVSIFVLLLLIVGFHHPHFLFRLLFGRITGVENSTQNFA